MALTTYKKKRNFKESPEPKVKRKAFFNVNEADVKQFGFRPN
jgi:hypothetical protein